MSTGPLTLIIETSNPNSSGGAGGAGEVGIAHGDELARARALSPEGRHDDALMPAIDALMKETNAAPADLGRIAVSVGPGGYSAVRIAVATAAMLGVTTGAACVPVPSCRVAACGAGIEGDVLVAMGGKRDSAWARVYRAGDGAPEALTAGESLDVDRLAALRKRAAFDALIADDHLPEAMRAWAAEQGITLASPAFTATSCLAASAGIRPVSPARLAPVYPREPEAVRKWRERA